jgi:hypothetical protein
MFKRILIVLLVFSLGIGSVIMLGRGAIYAAQDGRHHPPDVTTNLYQPPLTSQGLFDIYLPAVPNKFESLSNAKAIFIEGNRLYVGKEQIFRIYDISNPGQPVELSTLYLDHVIHDIYVQTGYAYLGFANSLVRMAIIDVTNASAPIEMGSYAVSGPGALADTYLTVAGEYAYLTTNHGGVQIIDISSPSSPDRVATLNRSYSPDRIETRGRGILIKDSKVYVAWEEDYCGCGFIPQYYTLYGLLIVDVSTPTAPLEISFYTQNYPYYGDIADMVMREEYIYMAMSSYQLWSWDISDHGHISVVPTAFPGFQFVDLATSGTSLYLTASYPITHTLYQLDITIPETPVQVTSYSISLPITHTINEVEIKDDYAYLATTHGLYVHFLNSSP